MKLKAFSFGLFIGDWRLSQSDCSNQKLQQSFIPGELPDKAFLVTWFELSFFEQKGHSCIPQPCQFTGEDAGLDSGLDQKSKFTFKV